MHPPLRVSKVPKGQSPKIPSHVCTLVPRLSCAPALGDSASRSHFLTGWRRFSPTLASAGHSKICHDPHGHDRFCSSSPIERRHGVRYRPVLTSPATLEVCSGASLLYGALHRFLYLSNTGNLFVSISFPPRHVSSRLCPFTLAVSYCASFACLCCLSGITSLWTTAQPYTHRPAPSHLPGLFFLQTP